MFKIMSVFGTRPEAIKLAPVIKELQKHADTLKSVVTVTAQHRQMLDSVLNVFAIKPDYDMNIMHENQGLSDITCKILKNIEAIYEKERPDLVLIQGDTTTVFAASLAAYYKQIPVGHVEAGLRSLNKYQPFPEEVNRCLTSVIAHLHFAPTDDAKSNLLNEGVSKDHICVTGNTVIDALLDVATQDFEFDNELLNNIKGKMILITAHRRESFGKPFINICNAILTLAQQYPDVTFVYPVHLNPNVRNVVYPMLGNLSNIILVEPLEYVPFVHLMKRAHIILTDSGGIQEEAPSLNKPVLILREVTERPEAVRAGSAKLVGVHTKTIITETIRLLEDRKEYDRMTHLLNPFGDGHAAQRIVNFIRHKLIDNKTPIITKTRISEKITTH
ncbi:MAG: UDP-N-acetylglucosamine 2-epimerase (non-hydrolyzing) [Candidatus Brocadia sp. AMX2]|nr:MULTISPECIES: UDP-N-acetylglucosamine 2-epimerase (non-hydrolyzing) [Brocadia]MBC6932089.1 UDP-N-acetylglucosamine 2-epimerase (non-hydrolyzing) [Candidatus Brocadia sp.]MBL1168780.1 UDP-N-acetylglucosamine 2-epimerase (non-hydrolyzing) [Candidatus Brocadia sp. AMX1]MCK6467033.1 UDP-N-acetylglucosamine 2-epimerase (non-hydrolyzing) [Candidatus Brocadia sinica]NOG42839.1 UDP-N-acetylglucosamine 2-epimerase (non-hydrolyzing) [Planctomycetota bacterium]KAA0244524.1 MAG: UDP-N-acetylglucosamine